MQQSMTTATGKVFGPYHAYAKMTFETVAELRRLRQQFGLTYRKLGERFGIDHTSARNIAVGKTWVSTPDKVVFRAGADELERISSLIAEGAGIKKIAGELGVTERSVRKAMMAHGIKSANPPPGIKAECKHGHPLNGENLAILQNGKRDCRQCRRKAAREYAQRKREALRSLQ